MEAAANAALTSEHSHWNAEQGAGWLGRILEKNPVCPRRALVLSAAMPDEAIVLAKQGIRTLVVDPDRSALEQAQRRARIQGVDLDTVHGEIEVIRPGFLGPVEMIYDRTFFHHLEPVRRAEWWHLAGRILPSGGILAGVFLVGRNLDGPPYPITLGDLRFGLHRLFIEEGMESFGSPGPGKDQTFGALFRHK